MVEPPAERANPPRTPSLADSVWTIAMRVDILVYLAGTFLAGILVGAAHYGVPLLITLGIVTVAFSRLTEAESRRAIWAAVLIVALGAAPIAAVAVLDALLALASLPRLHVGWLVGAVAGWILLPVLSAPAHWARGDGSVRDALARALSGSGERRRHVGLLRFGLTGLVLGALLAAGAGLSQVLFPDTLVLLDLAGGESSAETWWSIAFAFVPVTMLAPFVSAVLAERDDWLLAAEVAPPRPPSHALAPLWLAAGLMVVAALAAPVPAWQPGDDDAIRPFEGSPLQTVSEHVVGLTIPVRSAARPAVHAAGARCGSTITGPHFGEAVGAGNGRVVFADAAGGLWAAPLDDEGCRTDDALLDRVWARWSSPTGAAAWVAAVLLWVGTLLFPRLRPGRLHRVLRPGAFELGGVLELDANATVTREGQRMRISGGVFRSDDGQSVLRVGPDVLVLGMGTVPPVTRATLLAPTRPPDLSLRSGTAPFPADALLLGVGEPRNAAIGHEIHRTAILPWLALSAVGTALCVLVALTL